MIRFKELETLKAEVRSLIIINYEYAWFWCFIFQVLKLKEWLDDGMDTEVGMIFKLFIHYWAWALRSNAFSSNTLGSDELKTKKRELDTSAKKIRYRRRQKEVNKCILLNQTQTPRLNPTDWIFRSFLKIEVHTIIILVLM